MKRILLSIILAIGMTANTWADTVIDGIKYALNDDFTATVKGLDDPSFTGTVTIPETIKYYGNTYQITQIGEWAFYKYKFKVVNIGNSVTSIGGSAFEDCTGLTSVTIPNSVTSIGNQAFMDCSGLTSITIPNSVTSIGSSAFKKCSGLTKVIINDLTAWCNISFGNSFGNPLSYADHLYSDENTEITNLVIPDGVTSIKDVVFLNCSGLTSVTIPNSVTSIGKSAFSGCSGLTSVTIPNSVTSIGDSAFHYCRSLTSVTIGNSVTSIGNYTFSGCSSLTSVTIPNSVTSIGNSAFWNCNGLTSVTIPNSVTSIGDRAFEYCQGLTSITIGSSVTSIGEDAFEKCPGLTEVNVSGKNTVYSSIDGVLFNKSQTELIKCPEGKQGAYTIPNSVDSIGTYAFLHCNLTEINVDENNMVYSSIDGVLFNKSQTELIKCPKGKQGAYTIPNSVTSIGEAAFYQCFRLTSIDIPNSVTSIGVAAFRNCNGLTSVTIPNSVTSIGKFAFDRCSGLTSVIIPNSVTSIGYGVFQSCI